MLAERLAADGLELLAVDSTDAAIDEIKDKVALAVKADATDVDTLRSLGVDQVDTVVVAIGEDFEAAELALMAARELGVPRIYARANDHVKRKILKALGATQVIMPEEDAALRLASRLAMPNITETVELGKDHSMVQVPAPADVVGQTVVELGLREKYNINLVAVKSRAATATMILTREQAGDVPAEREDKEWTITIPTGATKIRSGDTLIMVGKDADIDRFLRDKE